MPAQPGQYLHPQRRALGRLARSGAFEPVSRLLLGAAGPAVADPGIPVALDLAADRAGVAPRQPGDGADRIARAQPVGDQDALLLIEVARVDPFGFVHGGTIPVHACLFVPPGGAGAPVAPYLAGALGDPDRMGGLGKVHALLVQQTHVLLAPRRAHQLPRRIFDAVERPTAFPATVFVSVAPGHLTLLAVGQVLQRSLELARTCTWGVPVVVDVYRSPSLAPRMQDVILRHPVLERRRQDQRLVILVHISHKAIIVGKKHLTSNVAYDLSQEGDS